MSELAAIGYNPGAFDADELAEIIREGDRLSLERAQAYGNAGNRRSQVAGLPNWTGKCWQIAQQINRAHFGFELEGIETPQFVVYRKGDYFTWHMDRGPETARPRKLSYTLQLSASGDYNGGDLQVYTGDGYEDAKRDKGAIMAFPSFILHQVTSIVSGIRKSLVVWAYGEPFR